MTKSCLTITLCLNVVGFEQTLIIGRSKTKGCLPGINISALQIDWLSNETVRRAKVIMGGYTKQ